MEKPTVPMRARAPAPQAQGGERSESTVTTVVRQRPTEQFAGRFRIEALLGQGGMGAVYRARDLLLDEPVALKTLRAVGPHAAALRERFRQEVKLGRRVTHSNVARTFDLGIYQDTWFLTMELLEGSTLWEVLKREGLLPVGRALRLMASVARTLEAVHASGVVHCDLKPQNLCLTNDGRVILTDFGLATASYEGLGDAGGFTFGTPAYMAPEQLAGERDIDHRADLFAFGVMVYEVLTGRSPWSSDDGRVPAALLASEPPAPMGRGEVPPEVELLVGQLLAASRDDRPRSAAEVAQTLEAHAGAAALETSSLASEVAARVRVQDEGPAAPRAGWARECVADQLCEGLRRAGLRCSLGPGPDAADDEAELSLRFVLEQVEGHHELSLRLSSVGDGVLLWSGVVAAAELDLVALCDTALDTLAPLLRAGRAPPALPAPSRDLEAQSLHLRGRHAMVSRWFDSVAEAVELLEQARVRAPADPAILADLGAALARLSEFGDARSHPVITRLGGREALIARAWATATEARDLDPRGADSWVALAMVAFQQGHWETALAHARHALSLEPHLALAHQLLGAILSERGPIEDARRHLERAMALDDQDYRVATNLWRVQAMLGDRSAARRTIATLERLNQPESPPRLVDIVQRRYNLWFHPERVRGEPFKMPALPEAQRRSFDQCMDLFARGVPVPAAALEAFFTHLAAPTTTLRRELLAGQVLLEFAAVHRLAWEEARPLLERLVAAGLRDLMWMLHAPVLQRWRRHEDYAPLAAQVASPERMHMHVDSSPDALLP